MREDLLTKIKECRDRLHAVLNNPNSSYTPEHVAYDLYQIGEIATLGTKKADIEGFCEEKLECLRQVRNHLPGAFSNSYPKITLQIFLDVKLEIFQLLEIEKKESLNTAHTVNYRNVLSALKTYDNNHSPNKYLFGTLKLHAEQVQKIFDLHHTELNEVNNYNQLAMNIVILGKCAERLSKFIWQYVPDAKLTILETLIELRKGFSHYYITKVTQGSYKTRINAMKKDLPDLVATIEALKPLFEASLVKFELEKKQKNTKIELSNTTKPVKGATLPQHSSTTTTTTSSSFVPLFIPRQVQRQAKVQAIKKLNSPKKSPSSSPKKKPASPKKTPPVSPKKSVSGSPKKTPPVSPRKTLASSPKKSPKKTPSVSPEKAAKESPSKKPRSPKVDASPKKSPGIASTFRPRNLMKEFQEPLQSINNNNETSQVSPLENSLKRNAVEAELTPLSSPTKKSKTDEFVADIPANDLLGPITVNSSPLKLQENPSSAPNTPPGSVVKKSISFWSTEDSSSSSQESFPVVSSQETLPFSSLQGQKVSYD